jgi:hypothetical protein
VVDAFSNSVSAMLEVLECMILFGEWGFQRLSSRAISRAKLSGIRDIPLHTLTVRVVKPTTVLRM